MSLQHGGGVYDINSISAGCLSHANQFSLLAIINIDDQGDLSFPLCYFLLKTWKERSPGFSILIIDDLAIYNNNRHRPMT